MRVRAQTQSVVIEAPRELCFEVVAAAGRRLEKRSELEWVVEFDTEVGDRTIRTTELLILDRPGAIYYRWLDGPLDDVMETIQFVEDDGRTRLAYSGSFAMRWGVVGWLIGQLRVKPLYDPAVREHLHQAKEVAEKRSARSKVYKSE